jgi:hypothetical protein
LKAVTLGKASGDFEDEGSVEEPRQAWEAMREEIARTAIS